MLGICRRMLKYFRGKYRKEKSQYDLAFPQYDGYGNDWGRDRQPLRVSDRWKASLSQP